MMEMGNLPLNTGTTLILSCVIICCGVVHVEEIRSAWEDNATLTPTHTHPPTHKPSPTHPPTHPLILNIGNMPQLCDNLPWRDAR